MKFGTQTITFTDFEKTGTADEDGNYDFDEVTHVAPWCRHRPMTFQEVVDADLDIATEWWKSTMPVHEYDSELVDAIKALKPEAVFECDGQNYQVHGGIRTHPDIDGSPFKSTIFSKKQIG